MLGLISGVLATMAAVSFLAPIKAEATATVKLDVGTSTVQQDLYCFYKDAYPVNTLSYLVPHKSSGDQYDDFKFITMYASKGNLYLYFYVDCACEFKGVEFEYSDSTTLASDKTEIVETPHELDNAFKCEIHDSIGTKDRFYKVVAKNFYTYQAGTQHRCKALRLIGHLTDITYICRLCEDAEYSWKDPADGVDQVYTYYKDNYIVLNQTSCVPQLIGTSYTNTSEKAVLEAKEIFWLFFNWDYSSKGAAYDLGNLVKAEVSYDWLTYDVDYRVDGQSYNGCYMGLYENPDAWFKKNGHFSREAAFSNLKTVRAGSTVTPSEKRIKTTTSMATLFFFWNITHSIDYKYNTIQALDDASLGKITDEDFKKFCTDNKNGYKYAIDFRESSRVRNAEASSYSNPRDFFMDTRKVSSTCHDTKSVVITKLAFQNQEGIAELNAIMKPVDTDYAVATTPNEYVITTFMGKETGKLGKNLLMGLTILAGIAMAGALVFVVLKLRGNHVVVLNNQRPSYSGRSKGRK
jgi:hypothetical protein